MLFFQTTVFAQAFAPEKDFVKNANQITDIPTLIQMADDALASKSYTNYEVVSKRLVDLRPFSPDFRFSLVKAYALQDKKSVSYTHLTLPTILLV